MPKTDKELLGEAVALLKDRVHGPESSWNDWMGRIDAFLHSVDLERDLRRSRRDFALRDLHHCMMRSLYPRPIDALIVRGIVALLEND